MVPVYDTCMSCKCLVDTDMVTTSSVSYQKLRSPVFRVSDLMIVKGLLISEFRSQFQFHLVMSIKQLVPVKLLCSSIA